ncbi:response regulator [Polyangium aurulentum]|uniref:response regulator n=1 Tax=Polyangium aurulentum TaxID=2567896 RepID=UPI0010AE5495|nr:response regulator [Polyangium aurulentum]UQA60024.1 response regulator [Polyangium aurulentum]
MSDNPTKKPIGRILLQQRALTQDQLDKALETGKGTGVPLASRLTENGTISEVSALKGLSEQSGVPGIDLKQICLKLADLSIVPREVAMQHKLLPVLVRDDRVFLAMSDPSDRKVIDEIEFTTGKRVFPYVALEGQLVKVIPSAYEMRERGETHYVGPNCPPEVRRKAGLTTTNTPGTWGGSGRSTSGSQPPPPLEGSVVEPLPMPARLPPAAQAVARMGNRSPVIVDDAMQRAAAGAHFSDAEFGHAQRDLSVMAGGSELRPPRQEGKRTVLVVDDENEIRNILRIVFEQRGYRVLEAERGQVALRLVKEDPPDVIVLDAMLPGDLHGFDIAKQLKGSQRYGHIPIVMVSAVYKGWRFAEDLKSSYKVDAYLEKPFRVPDVIEAVERALEQGQPQHDPEQISADAEKMLEKGIAAYQAGQFDDAIEHLREGTRLDPLAYRLHFHLGLLYGKRGQIYDAISELETALRINGRHFPALKNLAVLYQKAGFRTKAVEVWERALRAAPDEPTRQSIKELLLGLL